MKHKNISHSIMGLLIMIAIGAASCSKHSDAGTTPVSTPTVTGVKLTTDATFGNILTDNNGRSLYFFFDDNTATGSNCNGGCAITWPVFYEANPSIGTGLDPKDFGVITRADNSKQTTYKGWPLYYYMNDSKAGDVKGDMVANKWVVAKADYVVMAANAQLVGLDGANYTDQSIMGTGVSQYLTDDHGRTLYLFGNDTHDTNKFTAADFSNNSVWPIYETSTTTIGSIPSLIDKTSFTTTMIDGKVQLVFKGHPLYYFGQDSATKGNTKGVSFPTPGKAIWKVLNNNTSTL